MMTTPILHTKRLLLRPFRRSDAVLGQTRFACWDIIQHMSTHVPWPYPEDGFEAFIEDWLEKYENGEDYAWVIAEAAVPDDLIGVITITGKKGSDVQRGFWITTAFQNRGYMTEAVTAVQDWLFTATDLQELIVLNVFGNLASQRVKEKTGAVYVDDIETLHHNGVSRTQRWRVLRGDWLAHRERND